MIKIIDKKDCAGCYACLNICPTSCISMINDNEGFDYPKVNTNNCINCEACIKVCPTINKKEIQNEPEAYACINKNESVRLVSSSGGIFTLLAEQIIDDGGIVFGASFDQQHMVEHIKVEFKEELCKLRGSKYVQSKIGRAYEQAKRLLESDKMVLFTGTPCQIEGLKFYLGKTYNNLFCVDIVCHGVPSPKVWAKYIAFREDCEGSTTKAVSFRKKDEGWKNFSLSFMFNNGGEHRQNLNNDLYMKAFLKDLCLRPSCYACRFKGLHRSSDITLADFWGIKNIFPEMDDDKGTSLIFVNSLKGKSMLTDISDKVFCKEVNMNEAISFNIAAIKSAPYNNKKDRFISELDKLPFEKLVKKYCNESIFTRTKRELKNSIKKLLKSNVE